MVISKEKTWTLNQRVGLLYPHAGERVGTVMILPSEETNGRIGVQVKGYRSLMMFKPHDLYFNPRSRRHTGLPRE